ncbi:hypothetical protein N7499_010041 [Penicillium canescens]|nr:hypothetical protein N7522_000844 [Penicillium canescens]KAJ6072027.1 hypothetical protein N7499_010041 [Penicillium canescens]
MAPELSFRIANLRLPEGFPGPNRQMPMIVMSMVMLIPRTGCHQKEKFALIFLFDGIGIFVVAIWVHFHCQKCCIDPHPRFRFKAYSQVTSSQYIKKKSSHSINCCTEPERPKPWLTCRETVQEMCVVTFSSDWFDQCQGRV